jgi:diguanylate cyclase (GGDEF)-like protein
LQAGSWLTSRWLQRNGEVELWQPMAAILAAGVLLLPPTGVVLVFFAGTAIGHLASNARLSATAYNTGQFTVAAALGATVSHALTGYAAFSMREVIAAVLAVLVATVANEILLAASFHLLMGDPMRSTLAAGFRLTASRTPLLAAVGVVAGAAGHASKWAPLFAVPPLAGFQIALADHVRAKVDRDRIRGLLNAATKAHASVRSDEVRTAIEEAAAELLRCQAASIETEEPVGAGAGTAKLSDLAGGWLVVRDRLSREPLDTSDLDLLDALATIGSSALENARLVEQIQHQALHDSLTGLPNQVLFEDRVSQLATSSYRSHERFAVVMLDIDHFKKVNDSLGHSHGNDLLKLMADRLVGAVREIDTVARLGSDHFTLLLPGIGDADSVAVLAETLLATVRRPVALGGHELFMTATLGIAFFPEDGTRPEHLLRNADSAMHRAKDTGRDTFQVYATGMNELAHMRLVREGELHNALARDELRVRYQPQIDLRTGRIVGVEALVRWEHPVLGLIGPHEFIPLAEETGLVVAVDEWVLSQASRQGREWLDAGLPKIRMAVNLSGRHFQGVDRLVETVTSVLLDSGLPPQLLELEVTESIAVGEDQGTARALQDVRELGVKVAIDDFGMGYSMLGRLQRFPIDRLKIDRSFVQEIVSADVEAPIVAAMIALSHSLHIECVAEGVETHEQVTFLRSEGCDTAQGFLFSHPVEAVDIEELLRMPSVAFNVSPVS